MTNKILVTGGAGYIGSHTCKYLCENGYDPIVFDNLTTGYAEYVKWGELVVGNLQDTSKLIQTILKHKPISVIHFAGSSYVGESVSNPLKYYKNNIVSSVSLVEAMNITGLETIVFSSTCATYGSPDVKAITECTQMSPINPYGFTKFVIEQLLKDMSSAKNLKYVSLRYFNAAGADKDGEIGENHKPETHLIPLAIESALGGRCLNVFGKDYGTPDGTAVRDYIHVTDLAAAHLKALQYLGNGGESVELNLGSGIGYSVLDILNGLESIGVKPNFSYADRRTGDPAYLVADSKKANKILGWHPECIGIKEILRTAVNWHTRSNERSN